MDQLTSLQMTALWALLAVALIASAYAFLLRTMILGQDTGTSEMQAIWERIKTGTRAYLGQQFGSLLLVTIILAIGAAMTGFATPTPLAAIEQFGAESATLWVAVGRGVAFILGALLAYAASFLSSSTAAEAALRLASAARKGYNPALQAGYRPGALGALLTAGSGLLGVMVIVIIYGAASPSILIGFAAGASVTGFLLRAGGGMYTQVASSGTAQLERAEETVQKDKQDDQRSIATETGLTVRNAGSAAGIGADIFESAEVLTVAALVLGLVLGDMRFVVFPLLLRGVGIVASLVGSLLVRTDDRRRNARAALNRGLYAAAVVGLIGFAATTPFFMVNASGVIDWRPPLSALVGLVLALVLDHITGYFTATTSAPTRQLGQSSRESASQSVLSGLSLGFKASFWAVVMVALALLSSVWIYAGEPAATRLSAVFYGVSLTGLGMLTLAGSTIALNVFGVVAEHAQRIGQFAGLDKNARNVTSDFLVIGNTTSTVTRGSATALSVVAAVALFGSMLAVMTQVQAQSGMPTMTGINLASLNVFGGLLIGSVVPLLLASLTMHGIPRAAVHMVNAVQKQRNPSASPNEQASADYAPDYGFIVRTTTSATQNELRSVGAIVLLLPMLLGLLLGIEVLAGFLAGVILSAQVLALFQSNAAGAWTNARTYIEDGHIGGKHSDAHQHVQVGDAVGEPLRNAVAPAMNSVIKITAVVSLLIVPSIIMLHPPGESLSIGAVIPIVICAFLIIWALWYGHRAVPEAPVERSTFPSTKERF